nr:L-glutamate/aspartate neurotransmitter transporter, GLAST-1 {internal fragment} [rats, Wistar, Peptide Partial, 15 aa] [Rattus sp.]
DVEMGNSVIEENEMK